MNPWISILLSLVLIAVVLIIQWRYYASTKTVVDDKQSGTLRVIFSVNTVLLLLLEALIIYGILRGTHG